jgi:glycosyltransferase involved in cell wall biosynthesis
LPTIYFTVTNDLTYDQRMIRICNTLANAGYDVTLIGRKTKKSNPLNKEAFKQKRIRCLFNKSFFFYAEYNVRLFFYLLFKKMDGICAIDLDTILPCYYISVLKKATRIYDAHELFCEMKEIVTRPSIYKIWKRIEQKIVPKFINGYTVNEPIADEFKRMYNVHYAIIRNIALLHDLPLVEKKEKYILYQGAVNEARSFETLIPAMKNVNSKLLIYGDGNFLKETKMLIVENNLEEKVILKGKASPEDLRKITAQAYLGITIFENKGLSNYYSLANRFFDYLHAGIPQLCVNYPVYKEINDKYNFAFLVDDVNEETLTKSLNSLLSDEKLYAQLQGNCLIARQELNWQNEAIKLLKFYATIFG